MYEGQDARARDDIVDIADAQLETGLLERKHQRAGLPAAKLHRDIDVGGQS